MQQVEGLTKFEKRLLSLLTKNSFSVKEICQIFDRSDGCIYYYLKQLKDKGFIDSKDDITSSGRLKYYKANNS